jgi:hypothetical protein
LALQYNPEAAQGQTRFAFLGPEHYLTMHLKCEPNQNNLQRSWPYQPQLELLQSKTCVWKEALVFIYRYKNISVARRL